MLRILLLRRPAHSFAGQLIAWELAEPTQALSELLQLVMLPVRKELERILAALLGPRGRKQAGQPANFVLGLRVFHDFGRPVLERLGFPPPSTETEVDRLADAIVAFAISGLHGLRRRGR